jgi:hypothetical protein
MDTPREFMRNKSEREEFALGQGWQTFLRAHVHTAYTLIHKNFEEQNKVLAPSVTIIDYWD